MKNKIQTSIIIRTHNHAKLLKRLLRRIKDQNKLENYEIIVIDSYSRDDTAKLAKKSGCKVINISPEKFSHSYTFNLGAENAHGKILFYASVDIIPKNKYWAYNLIKHFKNKKVGGFLANKNQFQTSILLKNLK